MSEREFGEIIAKLDMLMERDTVMTGTISDHGKKLTSLSEDVAALKVTVPRNVAVNDQKDKTILKYIVQILQWGAILAGIVFGTSGAETLIKGP